MTNDEISVMKSRGLQPDKFSAALEVIKEEKNYE
jgi:hypothetical protein